MRLLIVGPDEVYSIENFYAQYLEEFGVKISRFAAQNLFYKYYYSGNFNKILYLAGLSGIIKKINTLFREHVEAFKPDVIWIFKGMEITPASIKWAKAKKILLVNYNPDNPFIFTGRGSGNKNIKNSIELYDLHFTYNLEIQRNFKSRYNIDATFLPFGFDISNDTYQTCQRQEEIIKTCFLGNPDKRRAEILIELLDKGVCIDVYGNNWKQFLYHKNVQIFEPVYGDEFWKVLRRYRIQLNLMRIHNEDSHNMRSFEIPGIGGIQLAPYTTEHQLFFEENKEIFSFRNNDECLERIKYLLSLSVADATELRLMARTGVIKKGYSYQDRAAQVYHKLKYLLKMNKNK